MDEKEHKKAQFNKIYANIPLGLRDEIVVVLENNEPLSGLTQLSSRFLSV